MNVSVDSEKFLQVRFNENFHEMLVKIIGLRTD